MTQGRVLVIDDDPGLRDLLTRFLSRRGFVVVEAVDTADGLRQMKQNQEFLDLVFLDYEMPDGTGLDLIPRLIAVDAGIPIVMMTGHVSSELAVRAAHLGAVQFLDKPLSLDRVAEVVESAVQRRQLERRLERSRNAREDAFGAILTTQPVMQSVIDMARRVAATGASVLLTGESGAGKELFAQAIHRASDRAGGPFVAINCAAIPGELLESELFGVRKGAFTGADQDRRGRIEEASGGTLFLDEIGDMDPLLQAKLLRVLQERRVAALGGGPERAVDIRVVSATHRDLRSRAAEGGFREDLYYRLAEFPIRIPPLRERPGDVPLLVHAFLGQLVEVGIACAEIDDVVLEAFLGYDWPGNVRELQNVIRRAAIMAGDTRIRLQHLPSEFLSAASIDPGALQAAWASAAPEQPAQGDAALVPAWASAEDVWRMEDVERAVIAAGLQACGDNLSELAKRLGIGRTTLYRKLEAYGLTPGEAGD